MLKGEVSVYFFWKRLIDIVISFIFLLLLSPVFLVLAIVIKLDSRGPIIYKQERVGKDMKLFVMYKFRTMQVDTPSLANHLFTDMAKHITKSGLFLRKTSMDELPQLYNIFIGNMSLVGPRPVLASQKDILEARLRCGASSIKPGLTGLAQINGRDSLSTLEKVHFDGEYVQKVGFLFDLQIILKTIVVVWKKDGYHEGSER